MISFGSASWLFAADWDRQLPRPSLDAPGIA